MLKKLSDFAQTLGLEITPSQWQQLSMYAELVWQKKDQLNLTSVVDKNEILTRHIADGFAVAVVWNKYFAERKTGAAADMGSGAGYIGITLAIMCPQVQVNLIESLQKRCTFLNWVVLKLGLSNVTVQNIRLGQEKAGPFDLVTERAMGPLENLLPLLAACATDGGIVTAYQSQLGQANDAQMSKSNLEPLPPLAYVLPAEEKERYLTVFKHGHH